MKIKHALLAGLCFCYFHSTAQTVSFGPELGLNLARVHFEPKSVQGTANINSKLGVKLGCAVDIGLGKGFSVLTGMYYTRKGVRLSNTFNGYSLEGQYRYNYIELPLQAKYVYKNFSFAAGPYIAAVVGAAVKVITTDTLFRQKIEIGNDEKVDNVKRMDAGLNFRTGYQFPIGLFLAAQYGLGLSNVLPGTGLTGKNSAFCVSVGYFIKDRKPIKK